MTQSKALLGGLFLAAALAFAGPAVPQAGLQPAAATVEMSLGDRNAPLTIIEYASMTCPHCAAFHNETLPRLKTEYIDTGKVRLVFREFPLDQSAVMGAVLARCAGPARFFPFVEVLFRQQSAWAQAPDIVGRLTQIGQLGGVTPEQFQACLADRELTNGILQTRLEGERQYNVESTPTFVVGTHIVEGALPYEMFKQRIEDVMAGRIPDEGAGAAASNMTIYLVLGVAALLIAGAAFFFLRRPSKAGQA